MLTVNPVTVTNYDFKTDNHRQEIAGLERVFAVDRLGYSVATPYFAKPNEGMADPCCLAISPHAMSILRDTYRKLLANKPTYDQLCTWKWEFKETGWYMPPEDATAMGLVWKEICGQLKKELEDEYPIDYNAAVKPDLEDGIDELLMFASARGCWLEFRQKNGYST
jgi:hypothetical protein